MKALLVFLVVASAEAATLPGFRTELIGSTAGFASSIAVDSHGILYYTTTKGGVFRVVDGQSMPVATVNTVATGNSGLLGMSMIDDHNAAVHYTLPGQTYDVISRINLDSGEETVIHRFAGDIDVPARGVPSEHHGGNPSVAPDGSIFVGIGDYGVSGLARMEGWNAGRIFRIDTEGKATVFASGVRNPFDMIWDQTQHRLILGDNGPVGGDEIHMVTEGANLGWPYTYGTELPHEGSVAPDYVWSRTVAPTGMALLNSANRTVRGGLIVGSFVAQAIFYFPDLTSKPLIQPIALIEKEVGAVIDVTQSAAGEIYFVTGSAIYHLVTPTRGDCNGDGLLNSADVDALDQELIEHGSEAVVAIQNGVYRGVWGCDANADGLITESDRAELIRLLPGRARAARTSR